MSDSEPGAIEGGDVVDQTNTLWQDGETPDSMAVRLAETSGESGYDDPEVLEKLYVWYNLSEYEIAELFDVSRTKVKYRLRKYGILRPSQVVSWPSKDKILEAYEEAGSISSTKEELGIGEDSLTRLMNYYGIERSRGKPRDLCSPANYHTNTHGYEMWSTPSKDESGYAVHRLVAIAEYGVEAVVGKAIHHKNGIKWDNRPQNLIPLTPGQHGMRSGPDVPLSVHLAEMDESDAIATMIDAGYSHVLSEDALSAGSESE